MIPPTGDDDGDDEGGDPAKAPIGAGKTNSDDDDADDSDDDDGNGGDEPDGESDGQDTSPDGDGADDDDDGVDPAIGLTLLRNWESRFEATKDVKETDPLAMLKAVKYSASDDLKAKVKKAFEEERDIDAIVDIVTDAMPHFLGAYDSSRVNPVLTEQQVAARNAKLVSSIGAFDEAHPGVRTPKISERMAQYYEKIKQKYGYKRADEVPVEDYFYMAGGSLRKRGSKSGGTSGTAPNKAEIEEQRKAAALASRTPERIGKPKNPAGSGKPNKRAADAKEVQDFVGGIRETRFDPFVIR